MNKREGLDLQEYMTKGVERFVSDALKATLKDPKKSAFLLRFAAASKSASVKRKKAEAEGEHIPPFLIASITAECNLNCAGCYAACNMLPEQENVLPLGKEEWLRIFGEAEELGISFILLAGGEPMLRLDVIEAAGQNANILFPVFTNGTFLDEKYLSLFERCPNLIPVLSIEGEREVTDLRRGEGIYDRLMSNMEKLQARGLAFGASVTVTTENLREVTSDTFLKKLARRGCRAVVFVEYVPVTAESSELAPGNAEREYLQGEVGRLRKGMPEMVFISFPGDEKSSGGCVAAGRGFFHINPYGGAEPCPFSPFSDVNLRELSLKEAMHSPLFAALRNGNLLTEGHDGGCVLYEKREQVKALLRG
ncbi:MAG: radical SAM protein [Firmicutes bacterium]|nr:radical SAM protein [Bacillota bacterium]